MVNRIADQVRYCLHDFDSLIAILSEQEDSALRETEKSYVENLNKFKIWAGNIGAHRHGQSSLDYRLRDASHIQQTVLRFLSNLQSNLIEASAMASGKLQILEEWSDSDVDDEPGDVNDQTPATELKQIGVVIRETIRCLLRLSMTIQNPAAHNRYVKGISIDASYAVAFDTQHVRSKFPDAEDFLSQRLGRAISNRGQFLKYSQNHRKRLKAGIDGTVEDTESTVALSLAPIHKVEFSSTEKMEDDRASQTSFATTVEGSGRLKVPPLPLNAEYGEEFECSICYCIVSVSNWLGWKRHIFNDLQPYVCIAEDCKTPNKMFSHRGAWHNHVGQESDTNLASNICPLCRKGFSSAGLWRSHVGKDLQQLALFAISMHMYDVGDDEPVDIEEDAALSDATSSLHSEYPAGFHDALDAGEDSPELLAPVPDQGVASPSLRPNSNDDMIVDDAGQGTKVAHAEIALAMRSADFAELNAARNQACTQCTAVFAYRKDLHRHIKFHTGEQRFECMICQARLSRLDNTRRHIMMRHEVRAEDVAGYIHTHPELDPSKPC